MAKMPELVQLRERYGTDDLAILGINLDDDAEKTRTAVEQHELDWPHVHASTAAKGKADLWERRAGIRTLPRVLILDRSGVLRADVYPRHLEKEVARLIEIEREER